MSTAFIKEPGQTALNTEITYPLSIFEEMDHLMQKIEKRAFSFFEERGYVDGFALDDWFRAESELVKATPIAVAEKDNEVIVRAEVPGFEAKELSVRAEPRYVSIYGKVEKKTEAGTTPKNHYNELSSNEVYRHIPLPVNVNAEQATAQLLNGVLEVTLPKAAPPRLIEVKTAA